MSCLYNLKIDCSYFVLVFRPFLELLRFSNHFERKSTQFSRTQKSICSYFPPTFSLMVIIKNVLIKKVDLIFIDQAVHPNLLQQNLATPLSPAPTASITLSNPVATTITSSITTQPQQQQQQEQQIATTSIAATTVSAEKKTGD